MLSFQQEQGHEKILKKTHVTRRTQPPTEAVRNCLPIISQFYVLFTNVCETFCLGDFGFWELSILR